MGVCSYQQLAEGKVLVTARKWIECGLCMENCPFSVEISNKIKEIVEPFGK